MMVNLCWILPRAKLSFPVRYYLQRIFIQLAQLWLEKVLRQLEQLKPRASTLISGIRISCDFFAWPWDQIIFREVMLTHTCYSIFSLFGALPSHPQLVFLWCSIKKSPTWYTTCSLLPFLLTLSSLSIRYSRFWLRRQGAVLAKNLQPGDWTFLVNRYVTV